MKFLHQISSLVLHILLVTFVSSQPSFPLEVNPIDPTIQDRLDDFLFYRYLEMQGQDPFNSIYVLQILFIYFNAQLEHQREDAIRNGLNGVPLSEWAAAHPREPNNEDDSDHDDDLDLESDSYHDDDLDLESDSDLEYDDLETVFDDQNQIASSDQQNDSDPKSDDAMHDDLL